jgi:hypothetical protein
MESMAGFRCWSAETLSRTVFSDIGQLTGDVDGVLLAAHTPVMLEHKRGPELATGGSGEEHVLEALLQSVGDLDRNTLVAVTGGSGSGKSHVVRWVHAHVPQSDPAFHVLYVPRAVQTLRELLRRIIDGLPGVDGSALMDRVDAAISSVKPGELQARLVNEMKIALDWTLEDRGPADGESVDEAALREDRNSLLGFRDSASGGRVDGLASLMDVPKIKDRLLRPDGHLSSLVHSYFDERSRRDDNDEIFTREDLPLRERGVRQALAGRPELAELWDIIQRQPDDALALLEEALRVALPRTVGLQSTNGDTLDSLFRESRKALRLQGRELILIFEDLAQFGLVDGELYDQFVTQPGEDLAPLRVVFAVTDGAYARMERTVRTRVVHEFRVGDSALADSRTFVGRYLNLARVGRERTERLWELRDEAVTDSSWMANACDMNEQGVPCPFRDKCHASFGHVDIDGLGAVGLYPYNETALRRALTHIGSDPTPRNVIDDCVLTNLQEADGNIAARRYPHERTRQLFDFKVRKAKDALQAQHPSKDPERNYRALVIWGDEEALASAVLEAFDLDGEAGPPPPPVTTAGGGEPPPRKDFPNPLLPLFQWQVGEELAESEVSYYRETLRRLTVERLNLDQQLLHVHSGRGGEILSAIFNVSSFDIEGSRGRVIGDQGVRLTLSREPVHMRVMAAARWFRDHGHFVPSLGKWPWPEGYEPDQLLLELECHLDRWAGQVRDKFLEVSGGSKLASQAIVLRAVALAAAGQEISPSASAAEILRARSAGGLPPSEVWQPVELAASEIARTLKAGEYVGEFAAVRQGETGQPQLIDPCPLDEALTQGLADPLGALSEVVDSRADPVLALAAQQLLKAVEAALGAEAAVMERAARETTALLEQHSPGSVALAAESVARDANHAGLFRPAAGYGEFGRMIEILAVAELPEALVDASASSVVLGQPAIRATVRMHKAIAYVSRCMDETRVECERGKGSAGDVSQLKSEVNAHVHALAKLVADLGPE